MVLSDAEKKELEENPLALKIWEELEKYQGEDIQKTLYAQYVDALKSIGDDIKKVSGGSTGTIINSDKDDKLFDRFMSVMTKFDTMLKALETGRRLIDPELAKAEKKPITGKTKLPYGG
jgi:hypothetical protein